mgnify:CR=1 FL=1
MIKKEEILNTLKEKYIGMNWNDVDYDEIICDFEDYEENGEARVIIGDKDYKTDDDFTVSAYIDTENATEFIFRVKNNVVDWVWMEERN